MNPPQSSFEKVPDHYCFLQLPIDEIQNFETCPDDSEKSNICFHSSEQEALANGKRCTFLSSDGVSKNSEVKDFGPLEVHLISCTLKFPTPKPRKTRAARLLRQEHIDTPSESPKKTENLDSNSSCLFEDSLKNSELIYQNVVYNQEQVGKVKPGKKSELHVDSNSDRQNLVDFQKAICHETSSSENMTPSLDTDSNLSSDSKTGDDSSMSPTVDKRASFIRCSTVSMSLPKQLKLACNKHFPVACNLGEAVPQMQKESTMKDGSSSKIVPKKPQRHSLPAAGMLKKAASEELMEKSSYSSNEEKRDPERNHLRQLCAQNHGMSSSVEMSKRTSEKPVWKLPHPILPFKGNPESLKSITTSSNSELSNALTKPRAKSLSAVDMDRCTNKPCKDSQRKHSLKKLLSMKLSVCFSKSDFQKFWSKSSQLEGTIAGRPSGGEEKGIESDWHGFSVEEKRNKPIKSYSADNNSLESQKKRKKSRGQSSATNGPRAESLDDQMLSREATSQAPCKSVTSDCAPDYENVRHYEEIPEYENFPFAMAAGKTPELERQNSSTMEDTDANVYEVEDLYEASDGQLQLGPTQPHSR